MTIPATSAALLLFQAAAAHDTVLMRALPPVRSGFEQVAFIASGLTSILALVLVVLLIAGLFVLRSAARTAGTRLDALLHDLQPLVQQALAASESVRATADVLHREVTSVHESVQEATTRVRKTVGDLADRVDNFNALLGKVHDRADEVVDVATTAIAGLAWGARALKSRRKKRKRARISEPTPAPDLDEPA
jgi:methyl-accepting chemotaxis protein